MHFGVSFEVARRDDHRATARAEKHRATEYGEDVGLMKTRRDEKKRDASNGQRATTSLF